MKISDVEFQADGSKVIFYYTAEGRVDFREQIKRNARHYKTRIEMISTESLIVTIRKILLKI